MAKGNNRQCEGARRQASMPTGSLDFVEPPAFDQRIWLATDRPGERMTIDLPMPGVRVWSGAGSDRHCTELHETHTLCLIHPGQQQVGTRWKSGRSNYFESGAGDVMVMELGEVHRTTRVYGKVSFSVVQLEPRVVHGIADRLGMRLPGIRASSKSSPALRRALLRVVQAVARRADEFELELTLANLVSTWAGVCGKVSTSADPVPHRGIRKARDAILGCTSSQLAFSATPRLKELAAVSQLSEAHFPHAFKHWLGISPHAYFNLSRLNPGRRMLEEGASATEVAAALAFADLPHFSRTFRRQFGLSPRDWATLTRKQRALRK